MEKKEFRKLIMREFEEPVKLPAYILKNVYEKIISTIKYNDQMYCYDCDKVVDAKLFDLKKYPVFETVCKCSKCGKVYDSEKLSLRVKKRRTKQFVFYVISYKNNCIFHTSYCLEYYYEFKDHKMYVHKGIYKFWIDAFDCESKRELHMSCRCSLNCNSIKPYYYDLPYYVNRSSLNRFYYSSSNYFSIEEICFSNIYRNVKKTFLKYFKGYDFSTIERESYNMYAMLKCLSIYPKMETIIKKCKDYTLANNCYSIFLSIFEKLKYRGKYFKYDYHLMNRMFTVEFSSEWYNLNLMIGKPYLEDVSLISYMLDLPKEHINQNTVSYLLKSKDYTLYKDYLLMAKELKLDLSNNSILYPKNLVDAHDNLSITISEQKEVVESNHFASFRKSYSLLEFKKDGYKFYLPLTRSIFKIRGELLKQCLFSCRFDERYLDGKSIILFVDLENSSSRLTKFTVELSIKDLSIVQLHGFSNDINASKEQVDNLCKVKQIIQKHLSNLTIEKGKVIYRKTKIKEEKINQKLLKGRIDYENQYQMLRL